MIPSYATHLKDKTPEQLAVEIAGDPPVVEVSLEELLRFQHECRGVYDCSWPTLAGELTLMMGREFTTWLNRHPEWSEARRPVPPHVMMYELLPLAPPGKPNSLMIYRWKLVVKGEARRRALVEQTSVFARMEHV